MNSPVHCLNCGVEQDWAGARWGLGPQSKRAFFTCPGCGWIVEVKGRNLGVHHRADGSAAVNVWVPCEGSGLGGHWPPGPLATCKVCGHSYRIDTDGLLVPHHRTNEGALAVQPSRSARNIVNQLFDLADVPVATRQAVNDEADQFVAEMEERRDAEWRVEVVRLLDERDRAVDALDRVKQWLLDERHETYRRREAIDALVTPDPHVCIDCGANPPPGPPPEPWSRCYSCERAAKSIAPRSETGT